MKIYPECIPCLFRRVLYEGELCDISREEMFKILSEALDILSEDVRYGVPTYVVSTRLHRRIYELLEDEDPYSEKKEFANELAFELLPKLRRVIIGEGGLENLMLASIITNSIDFGITDHYEEEDIERKIIQDMKSSDLHVDDTKEIKREIRDSDRMAYILDNCGEVIFDSLLVDEIKNISDTKISLFVRGEPIFNDVTEREAREVGIAQKVDKVIPLGERAVGVHLGYLPDMAEDELRKCDLILSKGMANYESLSEEQPDGKIAYVMKAKCEPVADSLGVEKGSNIAKLVS